MRTLCVSLLLAITAPARAADTVVLGAIGDSLSSGFDALRIGDNRDLSWTTGTRPESDSHLKKLSAALGVQVVGQNVAVAGSDVNDLERQVTSVLTYNPDYLTITIGANDVCSWDADDRGQLLVFQTRLQQHLQRIVDARPQIKIYLAAIPDMHNLYGVAVGHSGCQAKWDLFNLCPALLSSNSTEQDRQAFVGRWQQANDALATVASHFPDHVYHDAAMATTAFTWDDVSGIDCFHPSVQGQNLLSNKTWHDGWSHFLFD